MTHDDIIKSLGISALAEHLGQKPDTVRHWGLRRGGIPARYWTQVMEFAHQADMPLTYKALAESVAEAHAA